jgi:hypothetical protein
LLFVGWDWASTSHAVTILDPAGTVIDHWTLGHTEHDLDTTLTRLTAHGSRVELPVAIERSEGLVVDRLLAAGHPVRRDQRRRVPRRPAPLGRRGRQVRPRRQLQARRLPAHPPPSAASARTARPGHSPAASPGPAARRPPRRQDRGQQPTRRAAGRPLARG